MMPTKKKNSAGRITVTAVFCRRTKTVEYSWKAEPEKGEPSEGSGSVAWSDKRKMIDDILAARERHVPGGSMKFLGSKSLSMEIGSALNYMGVKR